MYFLILLLSVQTPTDPAQRRQLLLEQLEQTPNNLETLLDLSDIAEQRKDMDEAVAYGQRAADAHPDDPRSHTRLAKALHARLSQKPIRWLTGKKRYLNHLKRALACDDTHLPAYRELIGFHLDAPQFVGSSMREAERLARKVQSFAPKEGGLLLVNVYNRMDKHDRVVDKLQSLIASFPDDMDLQLRLGFTYQSARDYHLALGCFERAMTDEERHLAGLYQTGRTRVFGRFELETALQIFDQYIGLVGPDQQPSIADAYWRKGLIYLILKDPVAARAQFDHALAFDAQHQLTLKELKKMR